MSNQSPWRAWSTSQYPLSASPPYGEWQWQAASPGGHELSRAIIQVAGSFPKESWGRGVSQSSCRVRSLTEEWWGGRVSQSILQHASRDSSKLHRAVKGLQASWSILGWGASHSIAGWQRQWDNVMEARLGLGTLITQNFMCSGLLVYQYLY